MADNDYAVQMSADGANVQFAAPGNGTHEAAENDERLHQSPERHVEEQIKDSLEDGKISSDGPSNASPTNQVVDVEKPSTPGQVDPAAAVEESQLSKNARKKLKRRQEWEDERPSRKALRKEKRHQAQERKREKKRNGELPANAEKQPKFKPEQVPVTILIDCQFEEQMTPEELISMGGQLTRCYSDHRKARYRTHLTVSSFTGALKDRFEGILSNQHKKWDVKFRDEHFVEVAAEAKEWMAAPDSGQMPDVRKTADLPSEDGAHGGADDALLGEVVYLTSDSPDTLQTLKPRSTYIIGGIVDKNRHKGICYQRARDHSVKTAKLPIGDYIKLSSRHVLTTNHVHEIMLKWLEFGDWGQAFMAVIPQRKGGTLRTGEAKNKSEPGDEDNPTSQGQDEVESVSDTREE